MRTLLSVVLAILVILGIVSTNLWRELHDERQMTANLGALLIDARAVPRVAPQPTVIAAPAPTTVATLAATPAACKPEAVPGSNVVTTVDGRVPAQNNTVSERDLLKDPDYRKWRLAQRRLEMQRSNPGLGEALGLSEKDADRLVDLLAENQIRSNEAPAIDVNRANPQAANEELQRQRQARQKQEDETLMALLGTGGFAQWQEYQQTRGARTQAISLGSQLLQLGAPLSNAQLKPLTAALVAEQQRQRQDAAIVVPIPFNADPQARAQAQEEAQRRSAEANRRLLAAMAPSLNAQQLALFREQYETQEALNQAATRARNRALAARGQR